MRIKFAEFRSGLNSYRGDLVRYLKRKTKGGVGKGKLCSRHANHFGNINGRNWGFRELGEGGRGLPGHLDRIDRIDGAGA